jgi:hypothetical protein
VAALPVDTPETPGPYRLRVFIPARGLELGPELVEVERATPPTSASASRSLAAVYRVAPAGALRVAALDFLDLDVSALNAGVAVWLAEARDDHGEVGLRWRWLRDGAEVAAARTPWRARHDVFPGQSYDFQAEVPAPPEPGDYVLELGLGSAGVTTFADAGSPPLRLAVRVD